jgi:hypothetical protein
MKLKKFEWIDGRFFLLNPQLRRYLHKIRSVEFEIYELKVPLLPNEARKFLRTRHSRLNPAYVSECFALSETLAELCAEYRVPVLSSSPVTGMGNDTPVIPLLGLYCQPKPWLTAHPADARLQVGDYLIGVRRRNKINEMC